jgi:predicted acetyltransferase
VTSGLELRAIGEDEFAEFARVEAATFGQFLDEAGLQSERATVELDRTVAAFVDSELVGTTAAYTFDLTLPGGATVPVAGVTAVGVLPTHRRRGILRSMMVHQLDDVAGRGEPCAILNASEASIYERFGYGVASEYQAFELDKHRARLAGVPRDRPVRLITKEAAREVLPPIYEPFRRRQPGSLTRTEAWWAAMLGDHAHWKGGGKLFVVVADPIDGDAGGYAIYELKAGSDFLAKRLVVRELVGHDSSVEARLWQYCLDVDLVGTIEALGRPVDDPLRWRLTDRRALRVTRQQDYLWVRLLDVPAALTARTYTGSGVLVVDVADEIRPEVSGRYRLAVEEGRATVERTDGVADLRLGIAELGSLYLSGVSPSQLARAGRVDECTQGALALADRLFAWPIQPQCTTFF